MIVPHIFIANMQTWTKSIELANLDEKKFHDAALTILTGKNLCFSEFSTKIH